MDGRLCTCFVLHNMLQSKISCHWTSITASQLWLTSAGHLHPANGEYNPWFQVRRINALRSDPRGSSLSPHAYPPYINSILIFFFSGNIILNMDSYGPELA